MDGFGSLPAFYLKVPATPAGELIVSAEIANAVYFALTPEEILAVDDPEIIPSVAELQVSIAQEKNETYTELTMVPFRRNPANRT